MIYRIGRTARKLAIAIVLLVALALTGMRLLLPQVYTYRAELEAMLSDALDVPVKVGTMRAQLTGFRPELALGDIQVAATDGGVPAVQLQEIRLGVNLLESLWSRRLLSALQVTLIGAKFGVVRKADGSLAVTGLRAGGKPPLWLLQGKHYQVLHSEMEWRDETSDAAPLLFSDVDLLVDNDHSENRHIVHLLLPLPQGLGHALRLSLDTRGNLFEPGGINGRLYMLAKQINLAASPVPLPARIPKAETGVADLELWVDWERSRMTGLRGVFNLENAKLRNAENASLAVTQFSGEFVWLRNAGSWQLQARNLHLLADDMAWDNETFAMQIAQAEDEGEPSSIAAYVPHLNVADWARLAKFSGALPALFGKLVGDLQPHGELREVALFVEPGREKYAFSGQFSKLGWSADNAPLGGEGLQGKLSGDEHGGWLQMATQGGQIHWPKVLRKPLVVTDMQGVLAWRQSAEAWEISTPALTMATPDITTDNRLLLRIPKGVGGIFLDLQTAFANAVDARQAKHYLPAAIMDKDLLAWLDAAFVGGTVVDGAGLFHGYLQDFPFDAQPGAFQIRFAARDLNLHVAPDWPDIDHVNADVEFRQGGLSANLRSGNSMGLALQQGQGAIPSLASSTHVELHGVVSGDVPTAFAYLSATPLQAEIDAVAQFVVGRGSADADLDLRIPLTAAAQTKVDGTVHLREAGLTVLPLQLPVQAITGDLRFTEQGLYAQGIKARALDNPVSVVIEQNDRNGDPQPGHAIPAKTQGGGQTVLRLQGKVGVDNLAKAFPGEHWRVAQGQTAYQMRLAFPATQRQPASLQMSSDLLGVALDLPGSLSKKSTESRNLQVDFGFPEGGRLPATVAYGKDFLANLSIDKNQRSLLGGDIRLGDVGAPAALGSAGNIPAEGLRVSVQADTFELSPWLEPGTNAAGVGFLGQLRGLSLDTKHLRWQHNELGAVALTLRHQAGRWQGELQSHFASGKLDIPEQFGRAGTVNMDLQSLDLSLLAALHLQGDPLQAQQAPGLRLSSRKLVWQGNDLGELALEARVSQQGLEFPNVELHGANLDMQMAGTWSGQGQQSGTVAKGSLHSDAWGTLLSRLGWLQDMQATPGKIDFTLHWPGAPYQFSLENVQGLADVDMGEGRMLGVNPGIGRVLGILALDQWQRRLQLDFSDAYAEGLTYNRIKGRFELGGGYALTDNLVIEAVPAKIDVKGKTGLVARDWDQLVVVSPKTASALPIAGTIASKLISGAVSLVGGSEAAEGWKHITSSVYQVKGKWGAAEITPLHESDGLLRKVWTGMTDFSWLR